MRHTGVVEFIRIVTTVATLAQAYHLTRLAIAINTIRGAAQLLACPMILIVDIEIVERGRHRQYLIQIRDILGQIVLEMVSMVSIVVIVVIMVVMTRRIRAISGGLSAKIVMWSTVVVVMVVQFVFDVYVLTHDGHVGVFVVLTVADGYKLLDLVMMVVIVVHGVECVHAEELVRGKYVRVDIVRIQVHIQGHRWLAATSRAELICTWLNILGFTTDASRCVSKVVEASKTAVFLFVLS